MIIKGNRVPGVVKDGPIYLNYELTVRDSRKLVVVFSGVDSQPARNIASYYGYHNKLSSNVLHIIDGFGAHGCYLLAINGDFAIQKLVVRLIRKVVSELSLDMGDVFFIGTSKGGSASLFYSFLLGGGKVIAGEPQIKIGDFIFHSDYDSSTVSQSLAYTMTGAVDKGKDMLNDIMIDCFRKHSASYNGLSKVIYGRGTGYYDKHIRYLEGVKGVELVEFDFSSHNDCIPVFQKNIIELNDAGWEL